MTIEAFLRQGIENPTLREPWQDARLVFGRSVGFIIKSIYYGLFVYIPLVVLMFATTTFFEPTTGFIKDPPMFAHVLRGDPFYLVVFIWFVLGAPVVILKKNLFPSRREKIRSEYQGLSARPSFTSAQYNEAADVLREWKVKSYDSAVATFTKPIIDLLILADALAEEKKMLRRIVSLRAIEADRGATAEDDIVEGDG